jgi:hypothetical protein
MIFIVLWLLIVIVHALIRVYIYPLYVDLKPVERVQKGYLTWTENFTYNHTYFEHSSGPNLRTDRFRIHYRIDIHIKGLYRAIFKKPLNFEKELKKVNKKLTDLNGIDHRKFFDCKKKGKFNF